MNIVEFKIYRQERINDIRDAYADCSDQSSEDQNVRESWLRLRRNWNSHADRIQVYANEEDQSALMDCWRSIIEENRYCNEHEGIGLNIGLSSENIKEILSVSDEYWITKHLKNHPNYSD